MSGFISLIMLSELFGPSIFLMVLDLFLSNTDDLMNLREISRRINKNPGSVSPILPRLIERNFLTATKVGAVSKVYSLNKSNIIVQNLLHFIEDNRISSEHAR